MRVCPQCNQNYTDETLNFCLEDGSALVSDSGANRQVFFTAAQPNLDNSVILPAEIPTTSLPKTPSIAVLPFVNLTGVAENDYFCSGLAEEILNALAKIEKLKVAARTSSFSFAGKDFNVNEIGHILKVQTVLEGSVKKSGNQLRIHVQLVNAEDGYQLWTERYDCEFKDIFDVQDEITMSVVSALKLKLLGERKKAVLKRYTENTEVYQLYFKGRFELGKYTPDGWREAIEIFREAVKIEPQYTPAYASMALCQMMLWYYGFLPLNEAAPDWRATTKKVLDIDSSVAEARFMMAADYFLYEWKWEEAEREFKEAIRLNPNNADIRWAYGMLLALLKRPEEAVREAKKALERDPLSLFVNMQAGWIYWLAQKFDETLEIARRMNEQKPDFHGSYWLIGAVEAARGNYIKAIEAQSKSLSLHRSQSILSHLGSAYGYLGNYDASLVVLNKLIEMKKKQFVPALSIARIYSGLGDADRVFEWLEKAFQERNGELPFLKLEAEIDQTWGKVLKQDPRFAVLLRRLNLS
jgi:adenylate cyclase